MTDFVVREIFHIEPWGQQAAARILGGEITCEFIRRGDRLRLVDKENPGRRATVTVLDLKQYKDSFEVLPRGSVCGLVVDVLPRGLTAAGLTVTKECDGESKKDV